MFIPVSVPDIEGFALKLLRGPLIGALDARASREKTHRLHRGTGKGAKWSFKRSKKVLHVDEEQRRQRYMTVRQYGDKERKRARRPGALRSRCYTNPFVCRANFGVFPVESQ